MLTRRALPGPCRYPGCPAVTRTPFCPRHTPERAGYGTRAWRQLASAVVRGRPCAVCGRPARIAAHIVPRRQGGADSLANLRPLCASCHSRETLRRGERFPNAARRV